jgi:hypothetical protein
MKNYDISLKRSSIPTSGYGRIGSPSRKEVGGEWCINAMMAAAVMAVFIVYLMPHVIAPWLGVDYETYMSQYFLWTFIAGLIAAPFAWLGTKIIAKLIRSG